MQQTYENVELDLKGRTIRHHIAAANKHNEKYGQHCKAAGILLIEAKAQLRHGEWLPWLDSHGINERSARRLMQFTEDPAAHIAAKESYRQYNETARPNRPVPTDLNPDEEPTPQPQARRTEPKRTQPEPQRPPRDTSPVCIVTKRINQAVERMTAEQRAQLLQYANSILTGEKP